MQKAAIRIGILLLSNKKNPLKRGGFLVIQYFPAAQRHFRNEMESSTGSPLSSLCIPGVVTCSMARYASNIADRTSALSYIQLRGCCRASDSITAIQACLCSYIDDAICANNYLGFTRNLKLLLPAETSSAYR